MKTNIYISVKTTLLVMVIVTTKGFFVSSFTSKQGKANAALNTADDKADSIASVKAFKEVYKVLMKPRCMNCHPAGDISLQGDDSHLHSMYPKRGKDGHGLYAMKCANCHQPENSFGLHTSPGNPKWALPPADMKMVFQGKTARQLALQIKDFNQTGHKNKENLLEHARDTLVKAGWNMGEGRPAPPLTYRAFLKVWDTWIEKGMYEPAK